MRSNKAEFILANVRVINSDVPLTAEDSPDAVIVKTEKQAFLDKTHFNNLLPGEEIDLKLPGEYPDLLEHIAVHQYFMGLDEKRLIGEDEAVLHWYETVYKPVVKVVRDQQMPSQFPTKQKPNFIYGLKITKLKLTEEYEFTHTSLAWKLMMNTSVPEDCGTGSNVGFICFSPDLSDWGMKTGDWRRELLKDDLSPLIRRMMISLRDPEIDLAYLRSGIRFAKQYSAWVGIVHVAKRSNMVDSEWVRRYEATVQMILDEEGVRGNFCVARQLAEKPVGKGILERYFVVQDELPSTPDGRSSILPGWHSILSHMPGPVFITPTVVPDKIKKIVLAFSQSPKAREALYFADALSKKFRCRTFAVVSGFDEKKCESPGKKWKNISKRTKSMARCGYESEKRRLKF